MVKRNTLNRVKEHYDFVLKHYNGNTDCVFGVFLVGSQNYGLDDENSDVDTRAVVLPTLYELATNKPPVSTTLMFPVEGKDPEHVTVVDFRLWCHQLMKGNVNTLETLFTPYRVVNPKYYTVMNELCVYKEDFTHMNAAKTLSAAFGLFYSKLKYTYRETEDTKELFEKFEYNPKCLMGAVRASYFVEDFLAGVTFSKCMDCSNKKNELLELKYGKLTSTQARKYTDFLELRMNDLKEWFDGNKAPYLNPEREKELMKRLENLQYKVVKLALEEDFK